MFVYNTLIIITYKSVNYQRKHFIFLYFKFNFADIIKIIHLFYTLRLVGTHKIECFTLSLFRKDTSFFE